MLEELLIKPTCCNLVWALNRMNSSWNWWIFSLRFDFDWGWGRSFRNIWYRHYIYLDALYMSLYIMLFPGIMFIWYHYHPSILFFQPSSISSTPWSIFWRTSFIALSRLARKLYDQLGDQSWANRIATLSWLGLSAARNYFLRLRHASAPLLGVFNMTWQSIIGWRPWGMKEEGKGMIDTGWWKWEKCFDVSSGLKTFKFWMFPPFFWEGKISEPHSLPIICPNKFHGLKYS